MADYGYFTSLLESSEAQQGYSLMLTAGTDTLLYQAGEGHEGLKRISR